jgi:hypothetical protein
MARSATDAISPGSLDEKRTHPPRSREPTHNSVHFPSGGYVDAARRVVQDKQRGRRLHPFGEDDLLLVTARQVADWLQHRTADNAELPAAIRCCIRQTPFPQDKAVPTERQGAHADHVFRNTLAKHEPILLAVGRAVRNSGLDGAGGIGWQGRASRQRYAPRSGLYQSEQHRK